MRLPFTRDRHGVDALYDIGAAEALRRDVAGALSRAVLPDSQRPGGSTMRGKAAKHLRLAGHTLVVRAEPAVVADLVGGAVLAARARFRVADDPEAGEVAAWEAESMFGPFPRLVVRTSPLLQGATEVGATWIRMSLRFPQGGPFVERGITAARDALLAARVPFVDQTRLFVPGPDVRYDGDGTWLAADFTTPDSLAHRH